MSEDQDFNGLEFEERQAIERARPVSPALAKRVLEVLKKDPSQSSVITEEDIQALQASGITWKEMLETGMILMNSTLIFDDEVVGSLKFEFGTLLKRSEAGELEEKPWYNQGGNEVHRQDRDMLAASQETEDPFNPDPNNPYFVRLRGLNDEHDTTSATLGFLSRSGRMEWDTARLHQAASKYRAAGRTQ